MELSYCCRLETVLSAESLNAKRTGVCVIFPEVIFLGEWGLFSYDSMSEDTRSCFIEYVHCSMKRMIEIDAVISYQIKQYD